MIYNSCQYAFSYHTDVFYISISSLEECWQIGDTGITEMGVRNEKFASRFYQSLLNYFSPWNTEK